MATQPVLYGYWRSSAAYRVRIALGLKGIAFAQQAVHLIRAGGEQHAADYRALNPAGLVPALAIDGVLLTQSLAIVEYLEETRPEPPLLPPDAAGRARVRSLAQLIVCDTHPIGNLRVLQYLERVLGVAEADRAAWVRHWIGLTFDALEAQLARDPATGRFCHGDMPGLADAMLVPQMYNARRFQLPLAAYPTLRAIDAACAALPAFKAALPECQPDAQPA